MRPLTSSPYECTHLGLTPLEWTAYLACAVVALVVLVAAYIRLKYGFWAVQPVYHPYDVAYLFRAPSVIERGLPGINKYVNLDMETHTVDRMTAYIRTVFTHFIRAEYLRHGDNVFAPTEATLFPYFDGHNGASIVSLLYRPITLTRSSTTGLPVPNSPPVELIAETQLVGAITSRPLTVYFPQTQTQTQTARKSPASLRVYYVDYLCVRGACRKQGVAQQLIQTHNYRQRRITPSIAVSLFKREHELTGIVPLCVYSTYGFTFANWPFSGPVPREAGYALVETTPTNFHLVHAFVQESLHLFDVAVVADAGNLLALLATNNVYIYALLRGTDIVACYFYRHTRVFVERDTHVLSCFASIRAGPCARAVFVQGFCASFQAVAAAHHFQFCAIEDIAHNRTLVDYLWTGAPACITSPTAYFFYNFVHPTVRADRTLVIA